MYSKIYNFKDEEHLNDIANMMKAISSKDSTFNFEVDKENKIIRLFGSDKNILHKRSMWIINKLDNIGIVVYKIVIK